VVPAAQLRSTAEAIAAKIARNGPLAVQQVKKAALLASGRTLEEGIQIEQESKRVVLSSADAREGPRAFLEKRPPKYQGR
jgi:enoyl-CoA hydratase